MFSVAVERMISEDFKINYLFVFFESAIYQSKFSLLFQIKFLKSKEGTAMVQMGDSVAVERCVQNLNNVSVGLTGAAPIVHTTTTTHHNNNGNNNENRDTPVEHKLQLAFSKQPYLSEVTNPYPLPDKSPSYKEYITNKNNRFISPAMASKNRIQPPSKVIQIVHVPKTEHQIQRYYYRFSTFSIHHRR